MKHGKIKKFFTNDITLLVISFIIAFVIWFVISNNSTTDTNVTVSDIPVTIELPDQAVKDGLKVFSGDDAKCLVEVSGNRVTVGSLSANDIQVYALNTNNIISSGTYTLPLSAKKIGNKTNYNIVNSTLNPTSITVFIDKEKTKEFEIENQISFNVPKGSYGLATLSASKITLSGPESQISKIVSVAVQGKEENIISEKQEFKRDPIYLDKDGNEVDSPLITSDIPSIDVTLNVLEKKELDLKLNIINGPATLPEISLSPSKLQVATTDQTISELEDGRLSVATLDFSQIMNEEYEQMFDIELPAGIMNLTKITKVSVKFDLSSYEISTLTCSIKNNLDSKTYDTEMSEKAIQITVVGPKDEIEEIKASDVTAELNFTDLLKEVSDNQVALDVPIKCSVSSNYPHTWVYSTYKTSVNISKK